LDESVEDALVTFDVLVGVSDAGSRSASAQILRNAAAACQYPARRDRLLKAADAVAAGEPCALTPEGLTAKQAAAAQTVTQQEWEERLAKEPLPPLPSDTAASNDSEDEDEEEEDSHDLDEMDEPPPRLPHLPVSHFFPGLVVRIGRDFADAFGHTSKVGGVLKVLACDPGRDGYILAFLDRNVQLLVSIPAHGGIIENIGNAWFQPVPTVRCLEDLLEAIEARLSEVEDQFESDSAIERIESLREDIEKCQSWLSRSGERGPAPKCLSGQLAAKVFGEEHELTAWIRLLFAAVPVCTSP
jgi:hypothetical protein